MLNKIRRGLILVPRKAHGSNIAAVRLFLPHNQGPTVALDEDPLKDITAVRHVVFVLKVGIVYKNAARGAIPGFAGVQP